MTSRSPAPGKVLAALITVQVLFGVNYVVSKYLIQYFPVLVWASARIVVASIFMIFFALVLRRPHPRPDRKFFVPLIGFALLGTIINQASFLVGLKYTTSTNSAVLNTLIPIFTLLIVTARGQEALTARRVVGFLSAFLGVLVMRRVEDFTISNTTWIGDLLTILNCLSYALFLSFSKAFLERNDRLWTTAWLFVYGSFGITALSLPEWISFVPPALSPELWGAMAFSILGATLATYFLNFWALAHARSSQVAVFIYLQPVVASLIAWRWMGEVPELRTGIAAALILLGLLLSVARPRDRVPEAWFASKAKGLRDFFFGG
jgi:drug/metabolite transporter (DMT)-like permease